jgi:hypothetical protein
MKRHSFLAAIALTIGILGAGISAQAQPGPGAGPGRGPGMMMGPGRMGSGMFSRMCGPSAAGFAEWRIDRLEQIVRPTDAQRPKLDELKAASAKAIETMRAACPAEFPSSMPGRMEFMEKRLEGMLQSVKTVRPAFDAFYATLSEEQKARLNTNTGPRGFWRWRDRW